MKIFMDLDEVLVDFVGAAIREWGADYESVLAEWEPSAWGIVEPLSRALAKATGNPRYRLTEEDFWGMLDRRAEFWANLEPLPWWRGVLDLVGTYDWYIVTSPSLCPASASGKIEWLRKVFGRTFDRFILTGYKAAVAGPGKVLIDDRDTNVQAFRAAGGWGIVFPRHHNSAHWWKADPVDYVRKQLELIRNGGER